MESIRVNIGGTSNICSHTKWIASYPVGDLPRNFPIDQLTERLAAAVALLRAAGFEAGDIADALLSEGTALSTVTHGGPDTIRRLNGMGRLIQRRANGPA